MPFLFIREQSWLRNKRTMSKQSSTSARFLSLTLAFSTQRMPRHPARTLSAATTMQLRLTTWLSPRMRMHQWSLGATTVAYRLSVAHPRTCASVERQVNYLAVVMLAVSLRLEYARLSLHNKYLNRTLPSITTNSCASSIRSLVQELPARVTNLLDKLSVAISLKSTLRTVINLPSLKSSAKLKFLTRDRKCLIKTILVKYRPLNLHLLRMRSRQALRIFSLHLSLMKEPNTIRKLA